MIRRTLPVVLTLLCSTGVLAEQQTLFSFVRPTSMVTVTTEDTGMPQYNAEQTAEGEVLRRVVFNPVAHPTLRLSPQTGVWDWSAGQFLTLRLQSAQDWALTVDVTVTGGDGRSLVSRIDLPAGPAQTVMVPLKASSPLSQGMRAGPPMPWSYDGQRLLLTSSSGELDLKQVASVSLSIPQPKVAQNLLVEKLGLESDDRAVRAAYSELIDAYGQSTRSRWPEKIASDEQLKAADVREQQQLKRWLGEREQQSLDLYGGVIAGPAFEAQGFFRTEKRDGRWYLVTPQGHAFYSLGVNAVAADGGRTYVAGRETMFKGLPAQGEALSAFYGEGNNDDGNASSQGRGFKQGRWFDFYAANLQRTYAKPCTPVAERQGPADSTVRLRPSMRRAGKPIASTGCWPGVSIPWVTGAIQRWVRRRGCLTPCHCRLSVTTPALVRAWTGGAACPIRSTRALPWPPSGRWPSRPATTATILG